MKNDRSHIVATVLIVEDSALIRLCMVEMFSDADFRVFEASNAEEAIDILRAEACCIDVLFTNVKMPGRRNGMELAHFVSRHWPRIALLVTSGTVPAAAELPLRSRFLQKPYDSFTAMRHVIELARAA
jgi:two-component system, response regulator PdtaR